MGRGGGRLALGAFAVKPLFVGVGGASALIAVGEPGLGVAVAEGVGGRLFGSLLGLGGVAVLAIDTSEGVVFVVVAAHSVFLTHHKLLLVFLSSGLSASSYCSCV